MWWNEVLSITPEDIRRSPTVEYLRQIPEHIEGLARDHPTSLRWDIQLCRGGYANEETQKSVKRRVRGIVVEKIAQPHIMRDLVSQGYRPAPNVPVPKNLYFPTETEVDVLGTISRGHDPLVVDEKDQIDVLINALMSRGRLPTTSAQALAYCEIKTSDNVLSFVNMKDKRHPQLKALRKAKALAKYLDCKNTEVHIYAPDIPQTEKYDRDNHPVINAIRHARRNEKVPVILHKLEVRLDDGRDIMDLDIDDWMHYVIHDELPGLSNIAMPVTFRNQVKPKEGSIEDHLRLSRPRHQAG